MKRAVAIVLIAELCLALTASAKIFEWRLNSPQARAETFTAYHGETIRFNPVWTGSLSNVTASALYYQTNGMDRAWWQADGLTFAPSNDVGAASYRFFVRATDPEGVNYTANGLLRLLDSPGFAPNTIPPPVAALDFDALEVFNAPYYTKSETDAKIVELAPTPDLTGYATTQALMAEVSSASQAATNYTETVAEAVYEAATNYTDEAAASFKPRWLFYRRLLSDAPYSYQENWRHDLSPWPAMYVGDDEYATSFAALDHLWCVNTNLIDRIASATNGLLRAETDPTVSSWAKATTKPTYSLNEVCPSAENWLGVPGTTSAGKSIKVLAKTVNGIIEGGMTVTGSSNNDNNTTRYRYNGVTATRNGTATDYLFDTSSQSGVVRRSELAAITPGDYATVSNRAMSALQSYTETDPTVSSWAKASSKPTYAYSEITGKPTLAAVATSGSYNDLRDKPEIGGDYVSTNETGSIILHRYFNDAPYSSGLVGMSPGLYSRDYDGEDLNYAPCLFVSYSENGGGTRELSTNYWAGLSFDAIHVARTDSDPYSASLYFPTSSGTIALTSDIPEYTETNAVSTIVWHYGAETLTIPSGGTLSASTTGWKNGESMFLVLSPSGSYTVDANAVDLVGYNAWPTNTTLCVAFRYGSKILVNPITATE